MTKRVLLKIRGLQDAFDQEPQTEVTVCGRYFRRGRHHFIFYAGEGSDDADESDVSGANMIKIGENTLEYLVKGEDHVHLLFECGQTSAAVYGTGAGNLLMNVYTSSLDVAETGDEIRADLRYSLTMNDVFISECRVDIAICALPDQEDNDIEA